MPYITNKILKMVMLTMLFLLEIVKYNVEQEGRVYISPK